MEEGREESRKGEVELMLEKNCSETVSASMNLAFNNPSFIPKQNKAHKMS